MAASIYTEKMLQPNEKMLNADLAATKRMFDELALHIEKNMVLISPSGSFTARSRVG